MACRFPVLNNLLAQSAVVEYILPSFYGIPDFTTNQSSKWIAEATSNPSLSNSVDPTDCTDDSDTTALKKHDGKESSLKGHFTDALTGASSCFIDVLRESFEITFELITQLLNRCTWAGDRDGQCVALSAWDITITPADHSFLNRIGMFRVLQTVLDDTRRILTKCRCESGSDHEESFENASSFHCEEVVVSGSRRLTILALKIVHSLASQIAFSEYESDSSDASVEPKLHRQVSGPETLTQALFDMLHTELYTSMKQIITSFYSPSSGESNSRDLSDEWDLLCLSDTRYFEDIKGEKYVYRILRLLFSVASSAVCRRYLCSPKWLTLLFSAIGSGGLNVQRRLLRLLRKLLSKLAPEEVVAYVSDFFTAKDDILFERPLDDSLVRSFMSTKSEQ